MLPAPPYDMSSETASESIVAHVLLKGMVPESIKLNADDAYYSYVFTDFIVFPHRAVSMDALFSPTFDGTCRLGMGTGSGIWKEFGGGATYCSHEHLLIFKPSVVRACLGRKEGVLECPTTGPLWCGASNSSIAINGQDMTTTAVLVSPLGHRIWGGPSTPACGYIQQSFFSGLSIRASVGGLRMHLTGGDVVGEDLYGARLLKNDVICNHDLVPPNTLVIGVMDTGHSWAYSAEHSTLDVHESVSTTMLNTWIDVVVINLCIVAYMHFLSDRDKSTFSKVTVLPELIGILSAAIGVYRQQGVGGVYTRVQDIATAVEACELLTGAVVAALAAHCAAFAIEHEIAVPGNPGVGKDNKARWVRVRAARNFSHEYSLLGSIFLQIAPGISDTYQLYM